MRINGELNYKLVRSYSTMNVRLSGDPLAADEGLELDHPRTTGRHMGWLGTQGGHFDVVEI